MLRPWALASLLAATILLTACPGEDTSEDGGVDAGADAGGNGRDAGNGGNSDAGGDGRDAGNGGNSDAGGDGHDAGNGGNSDAGGDGHDAGTGDGGSDLPRSTILAGSTPASPANDNAPRVFGTAEPGFIVRVFTHSSCSGTPAAQATADASGAFSVTVNVADDSTTTFHAIAADTQGRTSGCSAGLLYLEDSTPPVPPVLTATPASPANDNAPRLSGTTEPGAHLRLYTAAGCSGVPVAQATADASGAFSVTVSVTDDTTTTFFATTADTAGNTSACTTGTPYHEDSTPPAPPELAPPTPASPANENAPQLTGTAEAEATLRLFTTEDCSGAPVAQATADATGAFASTVDVADDSTTSFYATATDTAGNTSACATGPSYQEDSTPPGVPALATPASPSNNNSPQLSGTAEAGATVHLFFNPSCSGAPALQLTADEQGAFSGTVTVNSDTTTTFYVIASDTAGNASVCTAGATYHEDSTPPATPVLSSQPKSPANNNTPLLSASTEAGAHVRIFKSTSCSGASMAEGNADATGIFSTSASVRDDIATPFRATATDAAGNTSPCSLTFGYVEDSTPPETSSFSSTPASPANHNTPRVTASLRSSGTYRVFLNPSCTGTPYFSFTSPVSSPAFSYSFDLNVADDTTTDLYEVATDEAGNSSACTQVFTYTEDSTPPASPTLSTTPASPANHNSPSVNGTTEPGAIVSFFTGATCTGTPALQLTADETGAFSAILNVADNTTTVLRTIATDASGNASPCPTTGLSYVEDSLGPSASAAVVKDGDSDDIDLSTTASQVSTNWSGFTDAHGIARYDFSLSTSTICPGTAVPPTDVGVGPAAVITGLSLTDRLYYSCMRAIDSAGNLSAWKASDGFLVDAVPPAVTSTTPDPDASGVDVWSAVTVSFSETVKNVNASSFQVTFNGSPAAGTVSCSTSSMCTFTPTQPYPYGTLVTATLTTAITDSIGRPLPADHSWSFSTRNPSWGIAQRLASDSNFPRVGLDDLGSAQAVWKTSSHYAMRHYVPGSGWQIARIISSPFSSPISPPALAVAPSGAFVGAMNLWESGQFTKMFGINGSGTTLPTQQIIGGQFSSAFHPRAAISPNGTAFALWYEEAADGNYLIAIRYVPGTGWVSDRVLRISSEEFADYTLAMDTNGNALAVWSEASSSAGPWTLFYSTWTSATGWSAPSAGPAVTGNSLKLDLAFSQNGTAMLVWNTDTTVYASRYEPGTGFGPAVGLQSSSSRGQLARVGMDANGNAIAIWLQGTSSTVNQLWANHYAQGTGWGTAQQLSSAVRTAGIAVEANGNAHVVFSILDGTNENFHTRRYLTSSGWGSPRAIDSGQSGEPQDVRVSVNRNGSVAAIWSRYRTTTSNSVDVWANLFD